MDMFFQQPSTSRPQTQLEPEAAYEHAKEYVLSQYNHHRSALRTLMTCGPGPNGAIASAQPLVSPLSNRSSSSRSGGDQSTRDDEELRSPASDEVVLAAASALGLVPDTVESIAGKPRIMDEWGMSANQPGYGQQDDRDMFMRAFPYSQAERGVFGKSLGTSSVRDPNLLLDGDTFKQHSNPQMPTLFPQSINYSPYPRVPVQGLYTGLSTDPKLISSGFNPMPGQTPHSSVRFIFDDLRRD